MRIKTIQWNVGGGKIRDISADVASHESYKQAGLDHIIETLKSQNPDIITLQETHANGGSIQAEKIAKALNIPYFLNEVYDKSHLEEGQGLGEAIISHFPIHSNDFQLFLNPKYELVREDGEVWICHNKGVLSAELDLGSDNKLSVKTLHLLPFRKFKVDPLGDGNKELRGDIQNKLIDSSAIGLIQGDFNYNNGSLKAFLPKIFDLGFEEIMPEQPTTTRGRYYDRILHKGLRRISSTVLQDVIITR